MSDANEFDELDDLDALPDPELMEEEETAAELLGVLLAKMGYDVTLSTELSHDVEDEMDTQVVVVSVEGAQLQGLIGRQGETLAALQYVARLMASQQLRRRVDFVVDVDGYRRKRQEGLTRLAMRMADKVVEQKRPITLESMSPFERRLIHMALRDHAAVYTKSIGTGDARRVRIWPKGYVERDERPYGADRTDNRGGRRPYQGGGDSRGNRR